MALPCAPESHESVSYTHLPSERFTVGQNIFACVKSIDENERIVLTHKELLGTWQENADLYTPFSTATGIVRSIENYGIFIELTPNLAGLAEVCEGVSPGDRVNVYIKSIIPVSYTHLDLYKRQAKTCNTHAHNGTA